MSRIGLLERGVVEKSEFKWREAGVDAVVRSVEEFKKNLIQLANLR